jgi:GNAT superfamily N-acetyltransferase
VYRSLQQVFRWLVNEDKIHDSPMARMRPPAVPDDPPPVLRAIYLAPEAIGRGIGRALHDWALDDLRERGCIEATLWVLRENQPARRFYEAAGWRTDGEPKDEELAGGTLHEVRYRRGIVQAEWR